MQTHAEEILDLVDENDNVIGSVSAPEANSNPNLIHREVAVIIYDEKNRILLQKRRMDMPVAPGIWTISAAGHINKGTTLLEAAHEELREELGFDTELEFLEKTLDKRPNETRFFYWYKGKFSKNSKIKTQAKEVADAKFVAKEDLEKFQKEGNEIGDISLDQIKKFWSGC